MAFTAPFAVANQLVVPMYGIKCFFHNYGADDYFQLLEIVTSLIHPLGVTSSNCFVYMGVSISDTQFFKHIVCVVANNQISSSVCIGKGPECDFIWDGDVKRQTFF